VSDERRVLRPVELSPSEAALAYLLVANGTIPGGRARDAASILDKVEAAMAPPVLASPESQAPSEGE